ncbi:unnamed protein product [Schistosoma mattheei]|uniref:Uncharacterized protein n=1 Tax=Schistosoma mattheei TaxID=31246 RepID=A0A183PEZ2_9TREM|nr:unnamed protein product [Schistosoma mattheei]
MIIINNFFSGDFSYSWHHTDNCSNNNANEDRHANTNNNHFL